MEIINLEKRPLILKEYVKRTALRPDAGRLIRADTLITENDVPIILYLRLNNLVDTNALRSAVRNIKYEKDIRTNGLSTNSTIFGYNPRNVIRKDYCSATRLAYEAPNEHAVISEFGVQLSALYDKYFPDVFARHTAFTEEKILPEWRITNTPFTSGIVNKNNPLKYHFDTGNFADVFSNMVVFKNGVSGGQLVCPEFDIVLDCADNSIVLFDGQKILHGVTPIQYGDSTSYRYSIVYYTLKSMWNCEPMTDEIARIRKLHTIRERKRANGEVDASTLKYDDK